MEPEVKQNVISTISLLIATSILAGAGYLMYAVAVAQGVDTEIRTSVLVVGSIAVLMIVLFIIAFGFRFIELADAKQALGLPEGSIRAMIALVLIMIFIIFGVYLFRMVGTGNPVFVAPMDSPAKPDIYPGLVASSIYDPGTGKYNVWVIKPITDDGLRLAQQLLTTVGTLVVAVSGFYFGSSTTAASGAKSEKEASAAASSAMKVSSVSPQQAAAGATVQFEALGAALNSAERVFLRRAGVQLECSDVLSSAVKARFTLTSDPAAVGRWDLVVTSAGMEAVLPSAIELA